MRRTKDEENLCVNQHLHGSFISDQAYTDIWRFITCRIDQLKREAYVQCYRLRKSHGSSKYVKPYGYKRRIFRLRLQETFILITCLVLMMYPIPTTADYYQRYVSKAMRNFSTTACEKEYLTIACPDGMLIDVKDVMYGRKVPSRELCPTNNEDGLVENEDITCEAKVEAECQGERLCGLLVYHRVFGIDPCPGTSKYLSVQYQCIPRIFETTNSCSDRNIVMRCRKDTVIGIYNVTPVITENCQERGNSTGSTCLQSDVFDDVSRKCHSKWKCSYSLPTNVCFNHVTIKYTCVPSSFLTSEIPTYEELQTTIAPTSTSLPATTGGSESTSAKEDYSIVQPTVTILSVDNASYSGPPSTTSSLVSRKTTDAISTVENTDSGPIDYPEVILKTTNPTNVSNVTSILSVTSSDLFQPDNGVHVGIENDFPMSKDEVGMNNSTGCANCTGAVGDQTLVNLFRLLVYFKDNRQDIYIALLLGVIVTLLLTICILLYRREKSVPNKDMRDLDQVTEETREDNRQSSEEHRSFEVEEPAEEDEHENMSLLGSILQRSVDSNNTVNRPHVSPNASYVLANTKPLDADQGQSEQETCGPKSIFGKICCNCCCSNPPWQRTRILKRHRGDVYHVDHRYSSSIDEEDLAAEFRSHETFPNMCRVVDNPSSPSPIPVLEDRINRTEQSFVTSPAVTSSTATPPAEAALSRSQQNFRPISRSTQRHHSVTPDPDSRHRIQQTFQPQNRQPETQRSDPALNRYTIRQQHNIPQPLTAPTSPVVGHHLSTTPIPNGAQHLLHVFPSKSPKPMMGSSMLHTSHPPPPVTPKYTPPPNPFFNAQQYPAFPDTYEHYDNAPEISQVTRRKQFPAPREYLPAYNHNYQSKNLSTFPTSSTYDEEHFVQAVQYRNVASNARAIDLAANARTVDLSHNSTVSRNSWIEIRRSSIYDNSLPRNSEMFDYYQQFMPHEYQMPPLQQYELPGGRNLNHYYP